MTFGYKLDQSLDGGTLPISLQAWTFGRCSSQRVRAWLMACYRETCRPGPSATKAAQTACALTFGYKLEQGLEGGTQPCGQQTWTLGHDGDLRLQP